MVIGAFSVKLYFSFSMIRALLKQNRGTSPGNSLNRLEVTFKKNQSLWLLITLLYNIIIVPVCTGVMDYFYQQ